MGAGIGAGVAAGLATGGMSALGALISGLFGNHQVEETNESNEAQTQATNESNERIQSETNQTNKDIADATNQSNADIAAATNQSNADIAAATNKSNADIAAATNEANKAITDSVNQTNKAIAEQNLGFQRENLEYQKALQQQIFEREDTAYQRTAADMSAAGLNPLTMNGTNASGDVVSTTPLNNDYQAQGYQAQGYQAQGYEARGAQMVAAKLERFQKQMASFEWLSNVFQGLGDGLNRGIEHGLQIDALNNQIKNDEVDRYVKMAGAGYYGHVPSGYFFQYPTQNGKPVNPADWNGKFDNPMDYYNPQNQYFLDRMGNLRQLQHDARYSLYNNSTDFERNITAFQTMLDNHRLESIAGSIKGEALNLFNLFQKMYNHN